MITPDREAYPDVSGSALYSAVLGVGGSPRQGGNSDLLLSRILKGATSGNLAVETLRLRDLNFQSCSGCEQCRKARRCTGLLDDMSAVYSRLLEARGLVLVSPTHHYNITALMKAFIDRLYCFYEFTRARPRGWSSRLAGQGRKAVLAAVCEQQDESDMGFTLAAMRLPLEALGYEIVEELKVFGIFDRAHVAKLPDIMAKAEDIGRTLAKSLG